MLKRLQSILGSIFLPSRAHENTEIADDIQFSVAVLLVEVIHADHVLHEQEQRMVIDLLRRQYALDEAAATELFSRANEKMKDAVSLYQYTSLINSKLSYRQKFEFMTNLWRVVFADGQVDRYEEHLVRRVADLIYLAHKDFIRAKHLANESPAW